MKEILEKSADTDSPFSEKPTWSNILKDATFELNLPKRTSASTKSLQYLSFQAPKKLSKAISELISRLRVSEYDILLAAFSILLYRYTSQEDIVIGTSGRKDGFHNDQSQYSYIPHRMILDEYLTFEEVAHRIAAFQDSAEGYKIEEDVPFDISLLSSTFSRVKSFENEDGQSKFLLEQMSISSKFSNLLITFTYHFSNNNFIFRVGYSEHFDQEFVKNIYSSFQEIILNTANNPTKSIIKLQILSEDLLKKQLLEWNDTSLEFPYEMTIYDLLSAQVNKNQNKPAIIRKNESLSYSRLEEVINHLINDLNGIGIAPNSVVAVLMEKSIEQIITMFSILKMGHVYVPLDPDLPKERLEYILKDCQPSLVITKTKFADDRLISYEGPIHHFDHYSNLEPSEYYTNFKALSKASDPAYIIYSSGSTGNPKGVINHHQGVVNRIFWSQKNALFTASDSLLSVAPIGFATYFWEVLCPLLAGGILVLAEHETAKDPKSLIETILENKITNLVLLPSLLQAILEHPKSVECLSIRRILCAGEKLTNEIRRLFFLQLPNAKLCNGYGSTEVPMGITYVEFNNKQEDQDLVVIGKPIANTKVYLLDKYLNIVPIGVKGEIFVESIGLACCYLNDDQLTQTSFIKNPYSSDPNSRLFRTKDIARYHKDGNIEILSRNDFQVKIRGYRVELEEIEHAIRQFNHIREVIVETKGDSPHHVYLIAYMIPKAAMPPYQKEIEALKIFLSAKLPSYMIPQEFVFLDAFPLTSTGKINRKLLSQYHLETSQKSEIGGRSKTEQTLIEICKNLLNANFINIQDHFLSIGGNSLLAMRLLSRIAVEFKIEIPIKCFFELTLKEICAYIDKNLTVGSANQISSQKNSNKFPLSYYQQRLWILDKYFQDSAIYNIIIAWKILGPLNIAAMQYAFSCLVKRQDILRTIIKENDGVPYQIVIDPPDVILETINALTVKQDEKNHFVQLQMEDELKTPFDLSNKVPIRAQIIKFTPSEHVLLVTVHHIAIDGWSFAILNNELSAHYNYYLSHKNPTLTELSIRYSDFAIWQTEKITQVLEAKINYWKQLLSEAPKTINLPYKIVDRKEISDQGKIYSFKLTKNILADLKKLSLNYNTTLYTTLLTIFQILLVRYSNQTDIVIGTPVSLRPTKETEDLIGFFVNMLPLRLKCEADLNFHSLIMKNKKVLLDAFSNHEVPFDQLIDHLNVERLANQNPLFQIVFVFQNMQRTELQLNDLHIEKIDTPTRHSKFDLTLFVEEIDSNIRVDFEYKIDLFEENTIIGLAEHFKNIVHSIIEDQFIEITKIPILSAEDVLKQVITLNNPISKVKKTLGEVFEEQVNLYPNHLALIYGNHQWTYQELNEKTNQMSHYFRRLGVSRNVIVAVLLEDKFHAILSILAIIKAGGAYLPLDCGYPEDRLIRMMEESQILFTLTDAGILVKKSSLFEKVKERINCISLNEQWKTIKEESTSNIENVNLPSDLAYVIYTSGSTGNPKGVMVEHKSIIRLVKDVNYIEISPADRFVQSSSISFDAATFEIWGALLNGACLLGIEKDEFLDIDRFHSFLSRNHVTILWLTAGLLEKYALDKPEMFSKLKYLLAGGDVLNPKAISRVLHCPLGCPKHLLNGYGPTENTTFSTIYDIPKSDNNSRIPIGKLISNTSGYVLDDNLRLLPLGVAGQLYVGGEGLARGYIGQHQLTEEKFIDNPYATNIEKRNKINDKLYKTGDIVRFTIDGNLDYIGRVDNQIKLRGFRIELNEIEYVFNQCEFVEQCVIQVHEQADRDKQLVAYVVAKAKMANDGNIAEAVRKYAERKLPEFMVPSNILLVDKFPLTTNGKIDYRNLSALYQDKKPSTYNPPKTKNEIELASIWEEVLNIKLISKNDNFFRIGGNSLSAIRVIAKAKSKAIHITTAQIFNFPILSQLAEKIVYKQSLIKVDDMQAHPSGVIPLTPIQKWFFDQDLKEYNHWNQAVRLTVNRNIDIEILNKALQKIVQYHDVLRLRFLKSEDAWRQNFQSCHVEGNNHLCELVNLGDVKTSDCEKKMASIMAACHKAIDIHHGPLIKGILFDFDKKRPQELFLTAHHLIIDAISWHILRDDLDTIYKQIEKGEEIVLPEKASTYLDWQAMMDQYSRSEQLEAELQHWLMTKRNFYRLPKDFDLGPNTVDASHVFSISLTEVLTQDLLHNITKVQPITVLEILFAALSLTLIQWTGNPSISVLSESHGRTESILNKSLNLSRTIGWFTSIFPVTFNLENATGINEIIKTIQKSISHIPNHGIGYNILRYLSENRNILNSNRHDDPEIIFNYLGEWDSSLNCNNLFNFMDASVGDCYGDKNIRSTTIEISVRVIDKRLKFNLEYSRNHFKISTIESIANNLIKNLHQIIDFYKAPITTFSFLTATDSAISQNAKRDAETLDVELNYSLSQSVQSSHDEKKIFLTGANGFLGLSLLYRLLKDTNSVIYCLLRGQSLQAAQKKIRDGFNTFYPDETIDYNRIHVVIGDLSLENFGLSSATLKFLISNIDVIYHNGAQVHHLLNYETLRAENVISTFNLLKWAATERPKELHFISTISAATNIDGEGNISELEPDDRFPLSENGYLLTKWVSEKLICKAAKKGVKIAIYRPGNITGHSQTGAIYPEKNHMLLLLKGCLQLGMAPMWDNILEMTPVDLVAQSIVSLSLQNTTTTPQVFNLSNPVGLNWNEYFNLVKQEGYPLELVPHAVWSEAIANTTEDNSLFLLKHFHLGYHSSSAKVVTERTQRQLQSLKILFPTKNEIQGLVKKYLQYLSHCGFIS